MNKTVRVLISIVKITHPNVKYFQGTPVSNMRAMNLPEPQRAEDERAKSEFKYACY